MELDKKQLKRIVKMTKKIWSLLTKDEKLMYFMDGTITFVSFVLDILGYAKYEPTEDEFEYILSKVIFTK